jgi:hypothetical protein
MIFVQCVLVWVLLKAQSKQKTFSQVLYLGDEVRSGNEWENETEKAEKLIGLLL